MHGTSLPTESETEQNKLPSEEMTTVLGDIRINLLSTPESVLRFCNTNLLHKSDVQALC
jgi:6-phosphogluconolactonase/glucosamine-6-phosphate isomerase/deaminase